MFLILSCQGPFRDITEVLEQRYKPLEPTLWVAEPIDELKLAREELRREEWLRNVNDNMWVLNKNSCAIFGALNFLVFLFPNAVKNLLFVRKGKATLDLFQSDNFSICKWFKWGPYWWQKLFWQLKRQKKISILRINDHYLCICEDNFLNYLYWKHTYLWYA